jgi:1,4-dihydroxy-2-naphthoate octaprenyltransferase
MPPTEPNGAVSEPRPEQFAAGGAIQTLRRHWLAVRPGFLGAAALPVLVGTAWGWRLGGAWDLSSFALALLATVLLAAASNVFNDVGDDLMGSDRINDARIYPFTGGSRVLQNGVMTLAEMTRLSLLLFATAMMLGVLLIYREGLVVLWFGLAGVTLGVLYSWPPVQLAAHGIGELTVACAFGVLPVTGAAWLQSGMLGGDAMLLSVPVSCWVTAILLINEVPDAPADASVGKKTLPVRLPRESTALLYGMLHVGALSGSQAWIAVSGFPAWLTGIPLLLFGAGMFAARDIVVGGPALVRSLRLTVAVHSLGCIWLVGTILLN